MSHDVFISYSSADWDYAEALHETFQNRGIECWLAPRKIDPGNQWQGEIAQAIRQCEVMVLLFSSSSNQSEHVATEVSLAKRHKKHVIPVFIEDVEPEGDLEFLLERLHWEDAKVEPMQPHWDRIADFLVRSKRITPKVLVAQSNHPSTEHYFAIQRQLIAQNVASFVGRTNVAEAFANFLQAKSGGYFVVSGAPGQGKSALACQFIAQTSAIHHLVSRTGGRADPRLILKSLVTQILDRLQTQLEVPDSTAELSKLFCDLAQQATAGDQRLILVFDGLDELTTAAASELPLLSGMSVNGLFVIVTSRPGEKLTNLQSDLDAANPGVEQQLYELDPLELPEINRLFRAGGNELTPLDLRTLAIVSEGNPLYLRAVADELSRNPQFDLQQLPKGIDGFYRQATQSAKQSDNEELLLALSVLAVARSPLTLLELSQITDRPIRTLVDRGIQPVRQFLVRSRERYGFYHQRFQEFVTTELLYADEIESAHKMLANWLAQPTNQTLDYRIRSWSYHLFHSKQFDTLRQQIDGSFLKQKHHKQGLAVLEDIEFVTKTLLTQSDPKVMESTASLIRELTESRDTQSLGSVKRTDSIQDVGASTHRTNVLSPKLSRIKGLDIYAGMLPKGDASADFLDLLPHPNGAAIIIGDAPGSGLKKAFAGRFLSNLFCDFVERQTEIDIAESLGHLCKSVSGHESFDTISLMCADVNTNQNVVRIANAGHPSPVVFFHKRQQLRRLRVRGTLLNTVSSAEILQSTDHVRRCEFEIGDVLLLFSDGLTEDHLFSDSRYGYRFEDLLRQHHQHSARHIGETILDDWLNWKRDADLADDVTLVVLRRTEE